VPEQIGPPLVPGLIGGPSQLAEHLRLEAVPLPPLVATGQYDQPEQHRQRSDGDDATDPGREGFAHACVSVRGDTPPRTVRFVSVGRDGRRVRVNMAGH
jgi:hypothetical protein